MSANPSFTERVRSAASELAPAEAKVLRVLTSSGLVAGLDTVASLAERSSVSGPTVMRFAAKLGFDSYQDLQRAIRSELEERRTSPLALFAQAETGGDAFDRDRTVLAGIVAASLNKLARDDIERAADLIADPRKIIFTSGGRFTGLMADMLYLHLDQMRANVHRLQDGLQSREDQLLRIDRRSVVLLFDVRRYEARTVEIAARAGARGAKIIAFTDPWGSPAAAHADIVLSADVRWTSVFDSMVPMAALCEMLITAVVEKLGEAGRRRMAELEDLRTDYEWTARRTADEGGQGG
jgi:DNA-binding MurR/RpiR family transcriptional regulator